MARPRPKRQRPRWTLRLETLESRCQPSTLTPASDVPDTLLHALDLTPALAAQVRVASVIGDNAYVASDVDWYRLDFAEPTSITLTLAGGGVLSLYNDDPNSPDLTVETLGRRLLEQASASAANLGVISRVLAPASYYAAVSGIGNTWFSPYLADSGLAGATGVYELDISVGARSFDEVALLATDIPSTGVYTHSPLAVHLSLSGDPMVSEVMVVQTLDGLPIDFVITQLVYFSPESNELQIVFAQALPPGDYQIWAFDANFEFLFDPLGFTVAGIEDAADSDDSVATAKNLGALEGAGLVQQTGAIGDNPNYFLTGDPFLPGPGADLDFYRFTINGPGVYSLNAEVFAGRIGSGLDAGLTLFRIVDGQAILMAGNASSFNDALDDLGETSLFNDPVLFTNLEAGEYVLVVSSNENALEPQWGLIPGVDTYDPLVNNSAMTGTTIGAYVLNLLLTPGDQTPPQVVAVSIPAGATLAQPPAQFTVQFTEPVNLPELVNATTQQPAPLTTYAVYVEDAVGQRWYPRLESYDADNGTATFVLPERLPVGDFVVHLAGSAGLTDRYGNPLTDVAVPFGVLDSTAPALSHVVVNPYDSFEQPLDLGLLYQQDLRQGVVVTRDFTGASEPPTDSADWYRLTLTETREYVFTLGGAGLNVPGRPVLLDGNGNPVTELFDPDDPGSTSLHIVLGPGVYVVMVSWDTGAVPDAVYELTIGLGADPENPTPLTHGPAPAFRLQLLSSVPPQAPAAAALRLPASNLSVAPAALTLNAVPSLPSGSALGLASGPLGGVGGLPEAPLSALRLNLSPFGFASAKDGLLLTDPEGSGGAGADGGGGAENDAQLMEKFWRRIVDLLFQSIKPLGLGAVFSGLLSSAPDLPASAAFDCDGAGEPDALDAMTPRQRGTDALFAQPGWMGVCAILAGLPLTREQSRRRPTKQPVEKRA